LPGVWPLLGLSITLAITTYQNTAGWTFQGASG